MRVTKRDEETIFLILKIRFEYNRHGGYLNLVLYRKDVSKEAIKSCLCDIAWIPKRMERITYQMCAENLLKVSKKKRLQLIEFSDRIMSETNKRQFTEYTAKVLENGGELRMRYL